MSDGNAALALALGAGAGLGLWYLLHDDEQHEHNEPAPQATPTDPPAGAISSPVPATASPACALRLDAAGLTADGALVDVPSAVDRCKSARAAELVLADDAPAEVYVRLAAALQEAGVTLRQRPRRNRHRNGRGPRYSRQGRTILRDGEPVLYLDRVDLGDQRFAITPHEADRLAQRVVDLLNGTGRAPRQAAPSSAECADPRNATTHRIFVFRTAPKNGNSRTRFYEADPPTTWEDAKRRIVAAGLLDERLLLGSEWVLAADPPLRVPPDRLRPLP